MSAWSLAIFVILLGLLSWYDLREGILPDPLNYLLLWLGLIVNLQHHYCPLEEAVLGALFGYLSLWLFYWCYRLYRGSHGMGYGDFKLNAALGAWLGVQTIPLLLLLSSLMGLVAYGVRGSRSEPMAFGPCLAMAGVAMLVYREFLIG